MSLKVICILLSSDFAFYQKKHKQFLMDVPQPNRLAMPYRVTGISRSIEFVLYPKGYIIFGIIILLETEVENRKSVVQTCILWSSYFANILKTDQKICNSSFLE